MCSYISVEAYLCICFTFQCECLYGGSRVQEEDESFWTLIYFVSNLRPPTRPPSSPHPPQPTPLAQSCRHQLTSDWWIYFSRRRCENARDVLNELADSFWREYPRRPEPGISSLLADHRGHVITCTHKHTHKHTDKHAPTHTHMHTYTNTH